MKKIAFIVISLALGSTAFAKPTVVSITQQKDKCIDKKPYVAGVNECLYDYLHQYQKILYQQKNFTKAKKSAYLKAVDACDSGDEFADRPQIYECQLDVTEKAYKKAKSGKK